LKDVALDPEVIREKAWEQVETYTKAREEELGLNFLYVSRHFYLEEIDAQWIDHLKAMDHLREGIGLRGYGQKDPKQEYKKEGYELFRQWMERISASVAAKLYRVTWQGQVCDAAPL